MDILENPAEKVSSKRPRPNRLREFRLKADITQADLAGRVGTTQSVIAEAEMSGKGIGDAKWKRIADILGTDVLTIRGWTKIYAKSSD